ncbi:hypothetical protein T4E_8036 [Trichinella pseudospiralis]|uniref:PiggyBac transposable element-derived protein domain-containing protein n=1 Tax=Trichinella pseudospiralis TaxID=6337 RepID=A0A0V0XUV9_TRIPS|nr:hypothetical protein T4E_8036 [Trichinella pseudospiralis]
MYMDSKSSFSNNFDDAASNYPDQEEHLIAASTSTSGESSEDELPDRKYMRVAVAESMEFTCKSGSAWTTTVPTTTQTLSHNLCLVLRTALGIQCLEDTVDEQLVSTHRQSKFRQYIRCKPGKYGIKIFCCCGAETSYPFAREIYVKRQPDLEAPRDEADLVKRLVKPGNSKGRNITMDNLFMSIPVTEDLLAKKTTTVEKLYLKIINFIKYFTAYFHSRSIILSITTMSEFQLFHFTENGLKLMLGENDTLRITTETTNGETEVVINLKVIAEDINQKTNQVNLNFTCPVRMNLICHEDSAPTDAVSTETDAESKDSEVTSTYDWYE